MLYCVVIEEIVMTTVVFEGLEPTPGVTPFEGIQAPFSRPQQQHWPLLIVDDM